MIKALKLAKTVKRNSMRKKTLTGHAEFISQNGVAKCGGAAVREVRINQAVSLANTRLKMTKKMKNSAMQQNKSVKDKSNLST